ncbi:MAG: transcription antitermination factor NusB [Deltaproteobacteria bacterium]|nr:transcription antitermination factor NusB [Deltaproteobacteria bacterium]
MGNRHKSREFTLQLLYYLDVGEAKLPQAADSFWEALTCTPDVRQFSMALVRGVVEHQREIDLVITRFSDNWTIDRMSHVDRNILRMAIYELLYLPEIPASVTINEAVEIGKRFGTEDSGAFINGILDRIAKENLSTDTIATQAAQAPEPVKAPEPVATPAPEAPAPADPETQLHEKRRDAINRAGRDQRLGVGSTVTIRQRKDKTPDKPTPKEGHGS